jgi:hypothetical protein
MARVLAVDHSSAVVSSKHYWLQLSRDPWDAPKIDGQMAVSRALIIHGGILAVRMRLSTRAAGGLN